MNQSTIIKKVTNTMKKIAFLFICVCIAMSLFTSFGKHDFQEVKIVGTIIACGNEPFVYPVIKTEKGKIYTAECSKETKTELLKHQGKKIEFFGTILSSNSQKVEFQQSKDGYFKIQSFEVLKYWD